MFKDDINREEFEEFSKIVLFCCNYSKRKVYINHLKTMLGYYLSRSNNTKLNFTIKPEGVEIKSFNYYLNMMQRIGFIELNRNFYGIAVIANKRLDVSMYESNQLQILQKTINKSLEDLQDSLGIRVQ